MLNEFKKCPYCHESISIDASKCRYCYEWISKKLKKDKIEINKEGSKISHSKKQIVALAIFAITFTSGIFVLGAKAFKMIAQESKVEVCSFNDVKTRDGYIFRLIDDPQKKESQAYVLRDKVDCKYYLKIGNNKFELTSDFQEKLLKDLENTSELNPLSVILPSSDIKKLHLSVDVVSKNEGIEKSLSDYIDNLEPETILTLQVYGGSDENALSQKKLNIHYTPVGFNMYKKTFERQRETVVYIMNKSSVQEKIDLEVINSNDKQYIKKEVIKFYKTYKDNEDYNKFRFLLTYLDYLIDNYSSDTEYRFLTSGNFSRIDSRYYDFGEKHFIYHSKRIIERLKVIEDAKARQVDSEKEVEIPSALPQFYTYFSLKFKEKVGKFKNICFELVQSEKDRNISWLNEKSKLFKSNICK